MHRGEVAKVNPPRITTEPRLPKGGNRNPSQREEYVPAYQTQKRDCANLCSANTLPFPFVHIPVCEICKVMELQPYFSIAYIGTVAK